MRSLLLISALALASLSLGLGIGDKAPPIKVETLVKGTPVDLTKGVHVVEFWATWCVPCKVSIPHLTELAHKYKGKADFTGVSIAEQGEDPLGQVKKFVAAMGPKMDYNVAFDGPAGAMSAGYMKAANQEGIPTAFLVKDGIVLWIGHPMMGLDKALDDTLAGKYDPAAAKAAFDKQNAEMQGVQAKQAAALKAAQAKQAAFQKLLLPVSDAMQEGNADDALRELDKLDAAHPDMKAPLTEVRFGILLPSGSPKLVDLAKQVTTGVFKDDAEALNTMAWAIVDPESKIPARNYDAALILAKRAAEASGMKNGSILDTYALCLFKTGDKAKAVEFQTKAVELAKADKEVEPASLKGMQDRLAEFKKSSV